LSIFHCHMIHTSTSLILPCWSSGTIVGIAVEILICVRSWSLLCLLPRAPISIVPILTIIIAWSHNTKILCIVAPLWWRHCRVRSLEIRVLNLSLRSLKSLHCNLHPLLLTGTENMSLSGRTIAELLVASMCSSALHLPLALHDSSSILKD
jgi:hypothetical protein